MIIAQWLYSNRRGTFFVAEKDVYHLGDEKRTVVNSEVYDIQKRDGYISSQTDFRLHFVME